MKKLVIVALLFPSLALAVCCGKSKKRSPIAPDPLNMRTAQYPINVQFINRWSARAMSDEEVSEQELMSLFEAARWAPSAYNEQPWHFLYVRRNDPHWNDFLNLLVPFNQEWVKNASVLVLMLSRNLFEKNGKANTTHSFDTGAAWAYLALQGHFMDLVVHGMSGFDYEKAREDLRIPECFTIEAMIAIGKKGDKENLSEDLRSKEFLSDRKKVTEFITHGPYLNC